MCHVFTKSALVREIGYLPGIKDAHTAMVLRSVVESTGVSHFIDFDMFAIFSSCSCLAF